MQRLFQENSNVPPHQRNQNNDDEEGHSPWTSNTEESSWLTEQSNSKWTWHSSSRRTEQPNRNNDELLKSMRKEMDEMKNALKGKSSRNLDGMIKRTDSQFTKEVLECLLLLKFRLPPIGDLWLAYRSTRPHRLSRHCWTFNGNLMKWYVDISQQLSKELLKFG